jgi:hypothetical protein
MVFLEAKLRMKVVCGYHSEAVTVTYLDTCIRPAVAMWMHHTWGPKFRSGTKGYDFDTLPNKSPATIASEAQRGGGRVFKKGRGKTFVKWFLKIMFLKT